MFDSLRPHESQHARPPCPSPSPGVHSDSRPLSRWCHPAISSSVVPFSSCPQSLPASESFPMSQLFAWVGQSAGVSALASFLPKKSQGWSPSEWAGWISLQSKGLSRVFSNTTVQKHLVYFLNSSFLTWELVLLKVNLFYFPIYACKRTHFLLNPIIARFTSVWHATSWQMFSSLLFDFLSILCPLLICGLTGLVGVGPRWHARSGLSLYSHDFAPHDLWTVTLHGCAKAEITCSAALARAHHEGLTWLWATLCDRDMWAPHGKGVAFTAESQLCLLYQPGENKHVCGSYGSSSLLPAS